jgi:hypothetical protein
VEEIVPASVSGQVQLCRLVVVADPKVLAQ